MAHPKVAYLACPTTMPNSPTRRLDAYQHDLSIGHVGLGLYSCGRILEPVSWDCPSTKWSEYECAIIGTTWDYTRRTSEYAVALNEIANQTRLLNPLSVVRWNIQKTYLRDLELAGCSVIPTDWCESVQPQACRHAFEQWGCDWLVIKPQVGAGSWRQVKLHRDDPWPSDSELPVGPAMIQPFQQSVQLEGEYSFIFFGRRFSHAVCKKAASGDYRIQALFGGKDIPFTPTKYEKEQALRILEHVPEDVLYARVDMLRREDGHLLLIELELIEPYLYPLHAPKMNELIAERYRELMD
jgi:hypothetical protein